MTRVYGATSIQVLDVLRDGPASRAEIAAALRSTIDRTWRALSRLMDQHLVRRLWRAPYGNYHGNNRPWIYGLSGVHYSIPMLLRPKRKRRRGIPAGPRYYEGQLAGWGGWHR